MSFLPDKYRSPQVEEWRIERRERSSFGTGVLVYIACIAVTVWFMWPTIQGALFPDQDQGPPQMSYGSGRYARPVDPVGPNLEGWGNRNHSGVTPRDFFGLAPRGGDGQERPCSPYHPTNCGRGR